MGIISLVIFKASGFLIKKKKKEKVPGLPFLNGDQYPHWPLRSSDFRVKNRGQLAAKCPNKEMW